MAKERKKSKATEPKENGEVTPKVQPRELNPALAANIWQPGQSGNPLGRPKGARSKLGEAFLEDFYQDWQQHGKAAIQEVRETRPQDYLKAAVSILPKEVKVIPGDFDEMTNDELDRRIHALARAISLEIGTGESAGREEEAPSPQPAGGIRTLQ